MPNFHSSNPRNDLPLPHKPETATFAMGCFWSPDALFGVQDGVIRTRVGYSGGTTAHPTYRKLGDHIESLQLDYDPSQLSYQSLLDLFFSHHKPFREAWKRQYMSAVFPHNKEQEDLVYQTIERVAEKQRQKVFTEVIPYKEWFMAEDRHQKYKLQRQPELMLELQKLYPDFSDLVHSREAARMNGFLYGYGSKKEVESFLADLDISPGGKEIILKNSTATRISCSA